MTHHLLEASAEESDEEPNPRRVLNSTPNPTLNHQIKETASLRLDMSNPQRNYKILFIPRNTKPLHTMPEPTYNTGSAEHPAQRKLENSEQDREIID